MTSLRNRLLVWLLSLLTVVGVLAGAVAFLLDRREVSRSLDVQLKQIAMAVGTTGPVASVRQVNGAMLDPEDKFVVTVWDGSTPRHPAGTAVPSTRPASEGYADFVAAGEAWRAYARLEGDRAVQVAQRVVVRDEIAATEAFRAVWPILALVPLSWLLVGWIVNRVLRPLHAVTDQLGAWGKTETKPLPLEGVPDEIMPLARATNDLVLRLQRQVEFREAFISDAAHELRTPLTALRLQAGNLNASALSPEQAELVEEMGMGVRRMADTVAKLLQLAKADAARPPRDPVPVDFGTVIADSLRSLMPLAAEKGIDIGVLSSTPESVLADPDDLRVLVSNLVENACRYAPAGGTIDLSFQRVGDEIVLEVQDTGPGIPEEQLDRVFERFVRLPGVTVEGSGLGLPIVRAIAERHGGRVVLRNRQNRSGLVASVFFRAAASRSALT